jgi:hypothetical protein
MSHIDVKIKIERVDEENGCIEVSFINPYGDIETGKKTLEDFRHTSERPSGNFTSDGDPIMIIDEWYDDNPNGDITYNYDIPVDENGNMYNRQQFLDWIALQYPHDMIVDTTTRRQNVVDPELVAMAGQEINTTIDVGGEEEAPVDDDTTENTMPSATIDII